MNDAVLKRELQNRYELIVCALIANGGTAYMEDLIKRTGCSEAQIAKALQFGRRNFDFKNRSVRDYVMASGGGYFLTDKKDLAIAYTVQTLKDVLSRAKTLKALYEFMKEEYPTDLTRAMALGFDDSDEVEPWAVFNTLIDGFY